MNVLIFADGVLASPIGYLKPGTALEFKEIRDYKSKDDFHLLVSYHPRNEFDAPQRVMEVHIKEVQVLNPNRITLLLRRKKVA